MGKWYEIIKIDYTLDKISRLRYCVSVFPNLTINDVYHVDIKHLEKVAQRLKKSSIFNVDYKVEESAVLDNTIGKRK